MRSAIVLPATLAAFVLIENLVFNTGSYAKIISPDSSSGRVDLMLWNEQQRTRDARPQVLAVGDSRMGFFPRYADQLKPALDYQFATISTPGSTPRDWYYMLRAADPDANRYAAILIPMEDYDDAEMWEDHADREQDLHYMITRLRWSDIPDFAGSYHSRELQVKAALGILLKGTVYQADFQDLLLHRDARMKYVDMARRESHRWYYDFVGTHDNVAGVTIDWKNKTLTAPASLSAEAKEMLRSRMLQPRPPDIGQQSAYLTRWLGKIYRHYRGSKTKLIFFRLPRGPFVRPDPPPFRPRSSVRELAHRPEVILDKEHDFDFLERPEIFSDAMHLNADGCAEFTRALARRVQELLGTHAL